MSENCREKIVSEEYADFIWKSSWDKQEQERKFPDACTQTINDFYTVFYVSMDFLNNRARMEFGYDVFPSLYTLQASEAMEVSNITRIQEQPILQLKGEGVIIGFVDTGERVMFLSAGPKTGKIKGFR